MAAKAGPRVINALQRSLVTEDNCFGNIPAARSLLAIADPAGLDALRRAIQGGLPLVFMTFLAPLGRYEDIPLFVAAWRELPPSDPLNQMPTFTRAIGRTGGEMAAATLHQLLDGANVKARISVVQGLGVVKHPAAVPALLSALNDEDTLVQSWARWELQGCRLF
ncbi:HEAT repeat domain-containing protein [Pseudomonas sp. GZD-222]|uniref:HEAT repeat domain-containing protein n=1 Tax=Pseudomonas sp. GZD-222 TaxID=3404805 RepID=UPI003BB5C071